MIKRKTTTTLHVGKAARSDKCSEILFALSMILSVIFSSIASSVIIELSFHKSFNIFCPLHLQTLKLCAQSWFYVFRKYELLYERHRYAFYLSLIT